MSAETPLLVDDIADLDRDIAAMLRAGGVSDFMNKWVAPQPDDDTKRKYARYISERIHSMLMGMLP